MGMPETTGRWTRETVLALPDDGKRYELFDGEQLAQPGLFVAPLGPGPTPTRWEDVPNPILVTEIPSPSTARYDRPVKRRRYQVAGVPEYWVVDLDARVVDRWRPTDDRPEILDERLAWQPSAEHSPLEIDLPALFREVWGEG
jgi:Uma2 family endonuclease